LTGKRQTGIEIPALAFLAVISLTSFVAIDPRRSGDQVWYLAAGFMVLLASAELPNWGISVHRTSAILLLLGLFAMAFGWYDAVSWYTRWLAIEPGQWIPQVSYRLALSNYAAAHFNILLTLALAYFWFTRSLGLRIVLGVYILSAAALIVLTTSRGGWFGTAAGLGTFATLLLWRARLDVGGLFQRVRSRWVFWAAGGAVLLLAAVPAVMYLLRMLNHPTHGPSNLSSRTPFWGPAWGAFLQSPLWGNGWNTFASFQMQVFSYPPRNIFLHAHNQYLDLLACSGLVGMAAFVWLLVRLVRRYVREIQPGQNPNLQPAVLGAAAALAAYLVHGIFDGLYRMPFASFTLVVLLGVTLSRPAQRRPYLKIALALLPLLVVLYSGLNTWRRAPLTEGVQLAEAGRLDESAQALEEAARRDPNFAPVHNQLGLVYALQADGGQPQALGKAMASFERTIELDPAWGLHHANLGALYRAAGDLHAAAISLGRAVEAAPQAALFHLNLGIVEEERGNLGAAAEQYTRTLELAPDWYPAQFWRVTAVRQAAAEKHARQYVDSAPDAQQIAALIQSGAADGLTFVQQTKINLENEHFEDAQKNIHKANLTFFHNEADRVELYWLQAVLLAESGHWEEAVGVGSYYIERWQQQSVYGPATNGSAYNEMVFGVPSQSRDMVPALYKIVPDHWKEREDTVLYWQKYK
jgi:O-antigen ligase/Tfp pilus assembly protein PilF